MLNKTIIQKALEAAEHDKNYAIATITQSSLKGTPRKIGTKMIIYADGSTSGTIGGGAFEKKVEIEALKVIQSQKPVLIPFDFSGQSNDSAVCGGTAQVFIEPYIPDKLITICGAGHIGLSLSVIMKMIGFNVHVVDDRKSILNKNRYGHIDKIHLINPVKLLKKQKPQQNHFLVIVTHDHKYDYACLETAIEKNYQYIGVIGSKTKRQRFLNQLKEKGIAPKYRKKMHMPCGMMLGGQTPQEIAVSIVAEIVSLSNMSLKKKG
ncbi:MAG: XdhC/CoxI family protein [Candidatus Omnitrophica bacterium]|nr:XdhC/CoxI family protein [Candidatus Omnitrophota bacterium]